MRIELEKADRETGQGVKSSGWSKDDPKVDGVYWWRADSRDFQPDIHSVVGGYFYEVAESFSRPVENFGGEWLGPLSPSDTEELFRLREAAKATLKTFQLLYDADAIPSLMQYQVDGTIAQLRKSLGKE